MEDSLTSWCKKCIYFLSIFSLGSNNCHSLWHGTTIEWKHWWGVEGDVSYKGRASSQRHTNVQYTIASVNSWFLLSFAVWDNFNFEWWGTDGHSCFCSHQCRVTFGNAFPLILISTHEFWELLPSAASRSCVADQYNGLRLSAGRLDHRLATVTRGRNVTWPRGHSWDESRVALMEAGAVSDGFRVGLESVWTFLHASDLPRILLGCQVPATRAICEYIWGCFQQLSTPWASALVETLLTSAPAPITHFSGRLDQMVETCSCFMCIAFTDLVKTVTCFLQTSEFQSLNLVLTPAVIKTLFPPHEYSLSRFRQRSLRSFWHSFVDNT